MVLIWPVLQQGRPSVHLYKQVFLLTLHKCVMLELESLHGYMYVICLRVGYSVVRFYKAELSTSVISMWQHIPRLTMSRKQRGHRIIQWTTMLSTVSFIANKLHICMVYIRVSCNLYENRKNPLRWKLHGHCYANFGKLEKWFIYHWRIWQY